MKQPKVSVIIPTYKPRRYIIEAIESVLNQSYKDSEIIVVDDDLNREAKNILQPYISNSAIRYISQENQGPNPARNAGIKIARGQYICFLDDDDVFLPDCFLKKIIFLETHKDVDIVFSDFFIHFENDAATIPRLKKLNFLPFFSDSLESLNNGFYIFNNNFFAKYWAFKFNAFHPSIIMARTAMVREAGGFCKDYPLYGDAVFCLNGIKRYRSGFIDEGLSIYYKSRSRTMIRSDVYISVIKAEIKYLNENLKLAERNASNDWELLENMRKRKADDYSELGKSYIRILDTINARKSFFRALKYGSYRFCIAIFLILTFMPPRFLKLIKNLRYFLKGLNK